MLGRVLRQFLRAATVMSAVSVAMIAWPAFAQLQNPNNLLFELIDQFQTGRNRPVLYGPEVQKIVYQQTGDTGVYQSLRQLGTVRNVVVTNQTPLRGGVLYQMTAMHDRGQSHWNLGYSTNSSRLEYVYFTVGKTDTGPSGGTKPLAPGVGPTAQPPASQPPAAPPPKATTNLKPLAPPGSVPPSSGPTGGPPSTPSSAPPSTPQRPPITTQAPPATPPPSRPPSSTETSAACQKFPNLC